MSHGPDLLLRRRATAGGIRQLWRTITERASEPTEGSYTAALLAGGTDSVARKVIEESGEVVLAAKNHENGGDRTASSKSQPTSSITCSFFSQSAASTWQLSKPNLTKGRDETDGDRSRGRFVQNLLGGI